MKLGFLKEKVKFFLALLVLTYLTIAQCFKMLASGFTIDKLIVIML
jgi:hypothetical protein